MKEIKTNMPLKEQVEILASYISENHSSYITADNGGAIQTAIAIMKDNEERLSLELMEAGTYDFGDK